MAICGMIEVPAADSELAGVNAISSSGECRRMLRMSIRKCKDLPTAMTESDGHEMA